MSIVPAEDSRPDSSGPIERWAHDYVASEAEGKVVEVLMLSVLLLHGVVEVLCALVHYTTECRLLGLIEVTEFLG